MILHYDGSLTGFCCLLGTVIKKQLPWTEVRSNQQQQTSNLFCADQNIQNDPLWAEKVTRGLQSKLGKDFIRKFGLAFLSETNNIEANLIHVTRYALKYGRDFLGQLQHPYVAALEKNALKTSRERHRLLGLIRFNKLADENYLACIDPYTNVIPLLGSHFSNRLADQNWIIADTKRDTAIIGMQGLWHYEANFQLNQAPLWHETETQMTSLWKSFYRNITNPQRLNPGLRNQFMPKHYWRYLTELQSEQEIEKTIYQIKPAKK